MWPFGYVSERYQNRRMPFWKRWIKNLRTLVIGNGDLHGLIRCPPLSRRLAPRARLVADIGCGQGSFHLESILQSKFEGIVIGVDINFDSLLAARNKAELCGLSERIFYICASADHLPFKKAVFNQVFLVDILEHIPNDESVLAEANGMLKKYGQIEISTPTPLYPKVFGNQAHSHLGHVRTGYLLNDLLDKITMQEFEIIIKEQNTGYLSWPWMGLWYRFAYNNQKTCVDKFVYNLILAIFSLMVCFFKHFDKFGGYCSNDVQARKRV